MKRVSAEIAAGTDEMTRQKRYKVTRYRLGLCTNCGASRKDSPFRKVCEECGEDRKKKLRRKNGSKPWKAGDPGRPPLALKTQEEQ